MSLSRSPSPHPGGGWSSPGLTPGSGSTTPHSGYYPTNPSWVTARAKSNEVRGYPSFSTRNNGFFSRSKRQITATLPRFRVNSRSPSGYSEKDEYKYGYESGWKPFGIWRSLLRRRRSRLLVAVLFVCLGYLFLWAPVVQAFRRSSFGGGRKFVVILESNVEGGVMELKGAKEWAIERNSITNKKNYASRWGYELEVVNMLAKKRYSHEWREGWEKVDLLRETMRKYPDAEWFWWLDLNTWIMEPSYSLQDHLTNRLDKIVYRDINEYNPLNITHPPTDPFLDRVSLSAEGDSDPSSINFLLSQDCGGFNLGSFLVRRSLWTERLLDLWWDPVMYEQKHMEWEHKEQDALEYLYTSQPWVRNGFAFLPQRLINSFPPGACGDGDDPNVHYMEDGRDFLVNMAGCQYGRDCWGEMYEYREYSKWLNRTLWQRIKDTFTDLSGGLSPKSGE